MEPVVFPDQLARIPGLKWLGRNLRWLKMLCIVLPLLFLLMLEVVRQLYLQEQLSRLTERAIVIAVMVFGVVGFSNAVFTVIRRVQGQVVRRNRFLRAANDILTLFAGSGELSHALPRVLVQLADLFGVEYAMACFYTDESTRPLAQARVGLTQASLESFCRHVTRRDFETVLTHMGAAELIEDAAGHPSIPEDLKQKGVVRAVLLPVHAIGRLHGLILLASSRGQCLAHNDLAVLDTLGRQIGAGAENIRLYDRLRSKSERLAALAEIGIELSSEHALDPLLQKIVNLSRELLGARYGAIGIVDDADGLGPLLTSSPEGPAQEGGERANAVASNLARNVLEQVVRDGRILRRGDVRHSGRKEQAVLGIPVISKGRVIGGLFLAGKAQADEFSPADEEAVRVFATQAAVAVDNARLYQTLARLTALEERERIAMDLHDGVIQSIYAVGLHLQACTGPIKHSAPDTTERIEFAVTELNKVIADIRQYIFELRSVAKRSISLNSILADAAANLRKWGIADARVISEGVNLDIPADLVQQISSMLKEMVSNTVKHAQASAVTIRARAADGRLQLCFKDDGVGVDTEQAQHSDGLGLRNLRRRAEKLGGNFALSGAPGAGTELTISVPLQGLSAVERRTVA